MVLVFFLEQTLEDKQVASGPLRQAEVLLVVDHEVVGFAVVVVVVAAAAAGNSVGRVGTYLKGVVQKLVSRNRQREEDLSLVQIFSCDPWLPWLRPKREKLYELVQSIVAQAVLALCRLVLGLYHANSVGVR